MGNPIFDSELDALRAGDETAFQSLIQRYHGPMFRLAMNYVGDRGIAEDVVLLYSSRAYEDIIYRAELERLAAVGDGLTVAHTLTRERPGGWKGNARRIDREMVRDVA